jgi:hypothetical protein
VYELAKVVGALVDVLSVLVEVQVAILSDKSRSKTTLAAVEFLELAGEWTRKRRFLE